MAYKINKVGKLPVNSRIFIDYTGEKPKIDFEYPNKDTNNILSSSAIILPSLLITLCFFSFFVFVTQGLSLEYLEINKIETYPNNSLLFNITYNTSDKVKSESYIISSKGMFNKILQFEQRDRSLLEKLSDEAMMGVIDMLIYITFAVLSFFISIYFLKYLFVHTSWGNKKFPKLNAKISNEKHYALFEPKDVGDNLFIEIPLFKNIELSYEATKEFSDYLSRVEIIEHPFNTVHKTIKGKKYIDKGIFLWRARFYFSQKPQDGVLEVKWT
jgi:hypothetical protein